MQDHGLTGLPGSGPIRSSRSFASDQMVRWCPGCGDFAVLAVIQKVLASQDISREKYAFISGIGCSSRFPYYMNTYGFHGIHGRALPVATGVKCANPELQVWVATGDGDALSIGGNHFIHTLRRNVDLKVILFNNRIYGLTKGQLSPTSEFGKKTKSTPWGSIEYPVNPVTMALASEATFVARGIASDVPGLTDIITRAAKHQGSVFVEILQNCVVFNDGAWKAVEDKASREERTVLLQHGKPLIFGKGRSRGVRLKGFDPMVVDFDPSLPPKDLIVHDEKADSPHMAYLLSKMSEADCPIPVGVFRAVRQPTLHELMEDQIIKARQAAPTDLQSVLDNAEEGASVKLLEYESKELFRAHRIPVPASGGVIRSLAQLPAALQRAGKGPWVIKAQVLAGGRGKAGGIKLARKPAEAREAARAILGMTLVTHQTQGQGLKVREVLVECGARIEREIYLSVVLDRKSAGPTVIASAQGGMEIEKLAAQDPGAILRQNVDPSTGLADFAARRLAFQLGLPPERAAEFCHIAKALVWLFLEHDCSLVEVNPLVLTPKGFVALDGKVVTDDNALFRHPQLARRRDPELSALEREAKKADLSYIALDGSIGCMVNGAGLAMGTMDTIVLAGGQPANFLDVGGAADEERVTKAFQLILKDPKVKAVLVNIFGGIVKCDMIASGILAALKKVKLPVPLIVRLQGTNVAQGRALLARSRVKIISAQDLWDAAQKAVEAAR